ncbi:hypothetical protein EK904_000012, partial [Melospiza melodia maxima]
MLNLKQVENLRSEYDTARYERSHGGRSYRSTATHWGSTPTPAVPCSSWRGCCRRSVPLPEQGCSLVLLRGQAVTLLATHRAVQAQSEQHEEEDDGKEDAEVHNGEDEQQAEGQLPANAPQGFVQLVQGSSAVKEEM